VLGFKALVPFFVMLIGTSNPFWYVFMGFQWATIRTQFRWLFTLPIPRTALLAIVMLPTLLGLSAGYAINIRLPWLPLPYLRGVGVRNARNAGRLLRRDDKHPDCKTPNVLPSLEYWIPVQSGKTLLITAPWGETVQPPIDRVMGLNIYNPYAVGCDSSRRFLEWQFQRAAVAIYGRSIPLDQRVDPYVERTAISSLRTQLVTIACVIGFSMVSLVIAMLFDWHRIRLLPDWVRVAMRWVVGATAFALLLWMSFGDIDPIQWVSWTLPVSLPGALAAAIVALLVLYAAIDRLSNHLEFVDRVGTTPT